MSNSERKQQNALDNQAQEYGDATFRAMEVLLKLLAAHVDPPEKVDNLLKRVEHNGAKSGRRSPKSLSNQRFWLVNYLLGAVTIKNGRFLTLQKIYFSTKK